MRRRCLYLAIVLVISTVVPGFLASSQDPAEPESVRSWPPDMTPYARQAVPEDYAPFRGMKYAPLESGAMSPAVFDVHIVDAVVSNTDSTLTNTDTFNDGETSIAVNPLNPDEIIITAFSGGWGANAPLWHSADGGLTWTKQFTVPAPPGVPAAGCPCDQTVDYGHTDQLSGTFLVGNGQGGFNIYSGMTADPADAAAWNWLVDPSGVTQATNHNVPTSRGNADQPWLLVNRDPIVDSQDNVYVAYDDFGGFMLRVAVAQGTNPPDFTLDNPTGPLTGFVNPGHRLAVDPRTGAVYSQFQRRIAPGADGSQNINYMLNRSTDGGQTWDLNGSATGIVVANADSSQPTPKFCTVNALLGGVLHAAVDPQTGDLVYVYGNRDPATGNNRLALRRIVDDGAGGVSIGAEAFVTGQVQAALPSVAVASDGTVGVFYYTCGGVSSDGYPIFTAHLSISDDQGQTFTDLELLTFLSSAGPSADARQRVLGDYMQMKAVGNTFYGAFTGNGFPFGRPFANHDPIFFRASVPIKVAVDIHPQSCPNPLNVGSQGVLPAAILGTATFDVTQMDVATVRLEGVPPLRSALEDVATPFVPFTGKKKDSDCTAEGPDGVLDLTLKFDTQAVVAALGPVTDGEVRVLKLTGTLLDGTSIVGEDVVVILEKGAG